MPIIRTSSLSISFFRLQFDFSGRGDIVRFIKEVQAQGLYVCLRIGPFIQAEWTYGYKIRCILSIYTFTNDCSLIYNTIFGKSMHA